MQQGKIARQPSTKAVVSVDDHGLNEYKKSRGVLRQKDEKIEQMDARLAKLEKLIQYFDKSPALAK